jgi:hypothetical protein
MGDQYKGTNLLHVRTRLRDAGQAQEELFRSKLNPDDLLIYTQAMAFLWYPMDAVVRIFTEAVNVLYPQDKKPFHALGYSQAMDNLGGIYRVILRVVTPEFAISQSARLWKTYFDTGETSIASKPTEIPGEQDVTFIVKNIRNCPSLFWISLKGLFTEWWNLHMPSL